MSARSSSSQKIVYRRLYSGQQVAKGISDVHFTTSVRNRINWILNWTEQDWDTMVFTQSPGMTSWQNLNIYQDSANRSKWMAVRSRYRVNNIH